MEALEAEPGALMIWSVTVEVVRGRKERKGGVVEQSHLQASVTKRSGLSDPAAAAMPP